MPDTDSDLSPPSTHWGPWTPGLQRHRPDWKSQCPLPQSAHTNAQSSPYVPLLHLVPHLGTRGGGVSGNRANGPEAHRVQCGGQPGEGGGALRVWGARASLTGRRSSPRCSACTCRSRGCRRARRDTAGTGGRSPRRRSRRRMAGRTWCRSSRARTSGSGPRPRCTAADPCTGRIWGRGGRLGGVRAPHAGPLGGLSLPPLPGRGPRLPAAAAQAVEAGGARLPAVLAPVAGLARARAVHRVAAAAEALAVALAARAERALPALAAAALLLARRRAAGALVVAAAAPPARVAQARARLRVAARRGAAVARAGALRAPPAGLAATRAAPRVARAVLALARMLAACAPAPRVTSTLARHVLTLPVRVADAQLLAVGTPELTRALCRGSGDGGRGLPRRWRESLLASHAARRPAHSQPRPRGPAPTAPRPLGSALTGVAVGPEVAVAAAAFAGSHAHLVLRARGVAFAHSCGRDGPRCPQASRRTWLRLSVPTPTPGAIPGDPLTDPTLVPLLPPAGAARELLGAAGRETGA